MIARALVVVVALAGCGRGAREEREPAPAAPTPRRPTATLELKIVDAGNDLSKAVFARAIQEIKKDNPGASDDDVLDGCLTTAAGVGALVDFWIHEPTGERTMDWYLIAKDRAALEAYLAASPPASDHEWGYELHQERCGRDRVPRPMWRSYHLFRTAELTEASVTEAKVQQNQYANQPEVMVTFDAEGTRRFAELTEKHAGHKMAILFAGTVTSAPVIMERISGGRMSVTTGVGSPEQLEKNARVIADALDPR